MKLFSYSFLILVVLFGNQCSKSEYGFRTNREIGNLILTTTTGNKNLYNFRAKGYIFFFGYSRCNTLCPMGLQTIHRIYANPRFPKGIIPFFVSIDLSRDSWDKLNQLRKHYDERIILVLPESDEKLRMLTKEFEVQFSKSNPLNPDYEINHSGNIYFVDYNFKLSRIFSSSHRDTDKIANEIINYYKWNSI